MVGLAVSDIIPINTNLNPVAAPTRNFGALLILGPTEGVIDTRERLRKYTTIGGVTTDFGSTTPEYLAATIFFGQSPQPSILYIGRWAQTATHAWLHGATISVANQSISVWNAITNGSISFTIDGTIRNLTGLNFGASANLNGVAGVIQNGLPVGAVCKWNSSYNRFDVSGVATGASGTITYATPVGSGTDISALTGLSAAAGASSPVPGVVAETALAAITAAEIISNDWYGSTFALTSYTDITAAQHVAIAAYVEASSPARIYGVSSSDPAIVDGTQSGDVASLLQAAAYSRSFVQYSSSNIYSVCSMYGKAFTVNFNASNSTMILMFQSEPGVVAETLNESQAAAAIAKNANVFVTYNNGVPIVQRGTMASGIYFDDRHNSDWLTNKVQTDIFNLFYTIGTKIPQTDPGAHVVLTTIENSLSAGVNNGMIAPNQWNGPSFGQIATGQFLPKGYYVYTPSVTTQTQAQRQTRILPPFQVAITLAGGVQGASVLLNINR